MTLTPNISVYVALIEVAPLDGCEIDPKTYGGAIVRCYVAAQSDDIAISRAVERLTENRFRLVDVQWCVDEAAVEWENPVDRTADDLIAQARNSDDVVFGEFHIWTINH